MIEDEGNTPNFTTTPSDSGSEVEERSWPVIGPLAASPARRAGGQAGASSAGRPPEPLLVLTKHCLSYLQYVLHFSTLLTYLPLLLSSNYPILLGSNFLLQARV